MDEELRKALEQSRIDAREYEEMQLATALSISVPVPHIPREESDKSTNWSCARCTYRNSPRRSCCIMCGIGSPRSAQLRSMLGDTEYEKAVRTQSAIDLQSEGAQRRSEGVGSASMRGGAGNDGLQMSRSEYEEALRAQLIVDSFTEEWVMNDHSEEAFRHLWGAIDDWDVPPLLPPAGGAVPQHGSLANIAAAAARRAQAEAPTPSVDFKALAGHSQNVHNAAIEGAAFTTIAQIVAQPLPAGTTVDQMIQFAILGIRAQPAGLPRRVADAACAELANQSILSLKFNNQVYKNGNSHNILC